MDATLIKRALSADTVEVFPARGGYDHVEARRGKCVAKFDIHDGYVNWGHIEQHGRVRWLAAAHRMCRELFPEAGIRTVFADPGSPKAADALRKHADWRPDPTRPYLLRWDLT